MKKLLLLLIIGLVTCTEYETDLDKINNFNKKNNYLKANMISLHFMIETDDPADTDTSFANLIKNLDLPVTAKGCKDGKYTGTSPQDAFDFYHQVELEIKDEKIISVKYDEYNDEGLSKRKNKIYGRQMAKEGTSPEAAYDKMQEMLKAKQSLLEVDGVSGATYSLYRFRYAVVIALIKAKMGIV
ncbi:MAG: FMN-binding protein [Candidatus Marinimicrobia bacterium]|nr:FMN-binding protein [Candidatus Neomarinimicrobiota bacterium]